jgi:AcrR family transcriptional regulator
MNPGGERADAIRNREAVLEAGLTILGRDASLSMQDLAAASGVARTTIYRHFADRDELLDAVLGKLIEKTRRRASEVPVQGRDAADVIRDLSRIMLADCFAYGSLIANRSANSRAIQASRETPGSPVRSFLEGASARGQIRDDVAIPWLHITFQAIPMQALDEVRSGRLSEAEAQVLVDESLVSVLLG